ncbi:MAG: hypothetical protein SNJ77_12650, partial [Cytophagales bacterium]
VGNSSDPKMVGILIHKILQSKKVKIYYTSGKFLQKLALVVKKFISPVVFEKIIEKKYGMKS